MVAEMRFTGKMFRPRCDHKRRGGREAPGARCPSSVANGMCYRYAPNDRPFPKLAANAL